MSTKTPKYAELYSELRHAILSGKYQDGAFLLTEGELMRLWGVSQTSVRHAIRRAARTLCVNTGDAMAAGFMEAQYLQVNTNTPLVALRRIARGAAGPLKIQWKFPAHPLPHGFPLHGRL